MITSFSLVDLIISVIGNSEELSNLFISVSLFTGTNIGLLVSISTAGACAVLDSPSDFEIEFLSSKRAVIFVIVDGFSEEHAASRSYLDGAEFPIVGALLVFQ